MRGRSVTQPAHGDQVFSPLTLALQRHERCGLGWERVHLRQARRLFSLVRLAAHKLFRDGCWGAFSASVSWRVQDLAIPRRWNLNLPLRFQKARRVLASDPTFLCGRRTNLPELPYCSRAPFVRHSRCELLEIPISFALQINQKRRRFPATVLLSEVSKVFTFCT